MKKTKFTGIIPALITPLTQEGTLNEAVLEQLIEHLISQGADGFYVGGATGEGIILDKEVHKKLAKESVRIINGRVPCIVHVARMNYAEMLEVARYADSIGADAISAIPPMFFQYDHESIYRYYEGLSDAVNIPIMIYNNPNTGVTFTPSQVAELYKIKNVSAIKWTNCQFYEVMRIIDLTNGEFNVFNGPDEMLLCGLAAGADGGIGSTYNYMLPLIKRIYNSFREGDIEKARKYQMQADAIIEVLCRYSVTSVTKIILEKQGFDIYHPLYPRSLYTQEEKDKIISELVEAGLEL